MSDSGPIHPKGPIFNLQQSIRPLSACKRGTDVAASFAGLYRHDIERGWVLSAGGGGFWFIAAGEAVKTSALASFVPHDKASRTGHNPATGMKAPISPRRLVTFRPLLWPRDWENSGMAGTGRNGDRKYFRPPVRASI